MVGSRIGGHTELGLVVGALGLEQGAEFARPLLLGIDHVDRVLQCPADVQADHGVGQRAGPLRTKGHVLERRAPESCGVIRQ